MIHRLHRNLRNLWTALLELEVQFQAELELACVVGGGGTAEEAAVAGSLVEQPYVVYKWRRRSFVEAVE